MPDNSLMRRILQAAEDRKEHSISHVRAHIAGTIRIFDKQASCASATAQFEAEFEDALSYLKQIDALHIVRRGEFRITDRGLRLLWSNQPLPSIPQD